MSTATETLLDGHPAKRADATLSSLSSGGLLPEEKANQFIKIVQNSTPLMQRVRVEPMKNPTKKLPKIIFAGRVVRADPGDATGLGSGQRVAPTTSEISLVAKKVVAEVKIGYDALEDNVEGAEFENTLITLLFEKFGVDMEELALKSDTTEADSTLVAHGFAQQDGWLKRITSNVVDASDAAVSRALLEQMRASVPLKYRQASKGRHAYFLEEHAGDKWREIIGARATALGDMAVTGEALPRCGGAEVMQVSNLPVASGSPDTSTGLYTDPKNLILGVYKGMTFKVKDMPEEGGIRIFVRTRVAFAVEQEDAACLITNLYAAP